MMPYDVIKSAHDVIKSAHDVIKSAHDVIKSAHDVIKSAHDVIKSAHIATGHGIRDRVIKLLSAKYENITREAIQVFIAFCLECQEKRKCPMTKGVVVKPILSCEYLSRGQVDLIDMPSISRGNFKWIMVYQDHLTKFCNIDHLQGEDDLLSVLTASSTDSAASTEDTPVPVPDTPSNNHTATTLQCDVTPVLTSELLSVQFHPEPQNPPPIQTPEPSSPSEQESPASQPPPGSPASEAALRLHQQNISEQREGTRTAQVLQGELMVKHSQTGRQTWRQCPWLFAAEEIHATCLVSS
ncbi:KRAB-A domain-containing protein 2 [Acipenser ruthenus]|uniref:KRAB-A domain-containing protein 2 n=1 Tax=Acipenser ruthenus TaxID=7906 RepID=A0A444U9J3_ACIRT|nr:KRAB-A domain-containing protein 2 [Acipenser ruthenus]